MSSYSKFVADIGGTHARFAVVDDSPGNSHDSLIKIKRFKCADYSGPAEALIAYQDFLGYDLPPRACIAAAGPVDRGTVEFTNLGWRMSERELRDELELDALEIVNDFIAIAYSVAGLQEKDLRNIHSGSADPGGVKAVIGAGTGLGVAAITMAGEQQRIVSSEGGHSRFAPADEEESELLRYLLRKHKYVSMEMLLSGPGLAQLHKSVAAINGIKVENLKATEISALALEQSDKNCVATLRAYSRILAGFCTQIGLTFHARGGIYLVGDIFRSVAPFMQTAEFRNRYLKAGAMTDLIVKVPLSIVLAENPGLQGAAIHVNSL